MNAVITISAICLVMMMVTSLPTGHYVQQRSPPPVKGGIKGNPLPTTNVRKGEYICGNRICKLKPGEIPRGCNGVCQYRVA